MRRTLGKIAIAAMVAGGTLGGLSQAALADGGIPVKASPCPYGYYGVAVYDNSGGTIAYACVRG